MPAVAPFRAGVAEWFVVIGQLFQAAQGACRSVSILAWKLSLDKAPPRFYTRASGHKMASFIETYPAIPTVPRERQDGIGSLAPVVEERLAMLSLPIRRARSPHRSHRLLGSRWRRIMAALAATCALVTVVAFFPLRAQAQSFVGAKYYYLALGDSLAYGYEPNLDWSHGYAQKWYGNLQSHGARSMTNYGCPGETSSTFINGGCPYSILDHNPYSGAQLTAAVSFIQAHAGNVSPVSLDIGANDLLPDINTSNCTVSSTWSSDLAHVDSNLTTIILPQLTAALTVNGTRSGDLVMMNYYDPYQNLCPGDVSYVQQLDAHLASDAAQFGVPIADVFTAFGGATTPNSHICSYTWMCSSYKDIHATGGQFLEPGNGYQVITNAFESVTGY